MFVPFAQPVYDKIDSNNNWLIAIFCRDTYVAGFVSPACCTLHQVH